jgi:hypothetical protein
MSLGVANLNLDGIEIAAGSKISPMAQAMPAKVHLLFSTAPDWSWQSLHVSTRSTLCCRQQIAAYRLHHAGFLLLKGDWEAAVRAILAPQPNDSTDIVSARLLFSESGDAQAALKGLPRHLTAERCVLQVCLQLHLCCIIGVYSLCPGGLPVPGYILERCLSTGTI